MTGSTFFYNQPLNDWNVSNVENMTEMFHLAESFNQPLNKWNDSKVKATGGMDCMFLFAFTFNQPLHAPWYNYSESE